MRFAPIPEPPEPEDLLRALLESIFGPGSWILYLFVFATWAYAWFSFAKTVFTYGETAYSRVGKLSPVRLAVALFWTLAVTLIQGVYLALSYFIAANIHESVRETDGPADVDFSAWFSAPASPPTEDPVFWIWFIIAAGVALIGWTSAVEGTLDGFRVFTWPLLAFGFCACFVPLIVAAEQPDPATIDRMKTLAIILIAYELSAALTVYAPQLCVNAWDKVP